MISLPAKALALSGLTIAGGGATYLIINSSKSTTPKTEATSPKPSIAKSLPKNKQLLDIGSDGAHWKTNWDTFKSKYSKEHASDPLWKLDGLSNIDNIAEAPQEFKQRCKDNRDKTSENNNKLLKEVEAYCTKEIQPSNE